MINRKKSLSLLLKLLLLLSILPLLYINVKSTHDWGDDFAQYIIQAKCICIHSFSSVYNVSGLEQYSPQFRPLGFSLILAPFYSFFGNNTYVFEMVNSVFLLFLCLILFVFFEKYFSNLISFLLVIVFAYNPSLSWLKQEIMSEIVFTFLIISAFLMYSNKGNYCYLKTCFFVSCLLLVKYIGIVLIIAYLTELIFCNIKYYIKHKKVLESKERLINSFIIAIVPLLIYYLVTDIIFKIPSGNLTWYNKFFISKDMFAIAFNNLIDYKDVFLNSFEQEVPHYVNILLKTSACIFFIAGVILKFKNKMELQDYFFVFYITLLLLYPYTKGGFRFLLPVFPLILLYITYGAMAIINSFFFQKKILIYLYFAIIIFSYSINIKSIVIQTPIMEIGPQDKYFSESAEYIKKNTLEKDCFIFMKPWAFNLFTDRKVIPFEGHTSVKDFKSALITFNVKYILACYNPSYELYDVNMLNLIANEPKYKRVWNNTVFALYKKNDSFPR